MRITIKLDSIDKIKKFVETANRYAGEIRLTSGKYSVDGKSIMGVYSLDLKNELIMEVKMEEGFTEFIHEVDSYVIRELEKVNE